MEERGDSTTALGLGGTVGAPSTNDSSHVCDDDDKVSGGGVKGSSSPGDFGSTNAIGCVRGERGPRRGLFLLLENIAVSRDPCMT